MAKKTFKKPNFKKSVNKNVEKQRNDSANNFGYLNLPKGVELFKEYKGKISMDIIPYPVTNPAHLDRDDEEGFAVVDSLWYRVPFKVHRGVGAGDGETVVCPTTFGKKCPICEHRKKRISEGADKEEIKALNTSKRNLYAVIPLGAKDFEEKVHIWNTSDYFVQELINKEIEDDEDLATFPDLEDGFTLKFRFDEESFGGHKYYKPSRVDFDERDEAYDDDIIKEVPNLDECLKVLSYKELEALLWEVEPEDIDDEDEDEAPKRRKKTPIDDEDEEEKPKSRKKKSEPEDEDEEEEKPKRKKKAKPEPEPEDEDEDEDEDDVDSMLPEGAEICDVCGGLGLIKKKKCKACKGLGYVFPDEDEDEDEDEESEEKVAVALKPGDEFEKRQQKRLAKSGKSKCPHGHIFGKDLDKFPEDCDTCDKWDDCFDEAE